MNNFDLKKYINDYVDFPKQGIVFKDWLPLLLDPVVFREIIEEISSWEGFNSADAIIAIDARGFIFGSTIAYKLSKPLILARKSGKLPGKLITKSYKLEYGNNELCIQEDSLNKFNNFVIIDDLLATGGTVNSVFNIIKDANKKVTGLFVLIELLELKGRDILDFPIKSLINY